MYCRYYSLINWNPNWSRTGVSDYDKTRDINDLMHTVRTACNIDKCTNDSKNWIARQSAIYFPSDPVLNTCEGRGYKLKKSCGWYKQMQVVAWMECFDLSFYMMSMLVLYYVLNYDSVFMRILGRCCIGSDMDSSARGVVIFVRHISMDNVYLDGQ